MDNTPATLRRLAGFGLSCLVATTLASCSLFFEGDVDSEVVRDSDAGADTIGGARDVDSAVDGDSAASDTRSTSDTSERTDAAAARDADRADAPPRDGGDEDSAGRDTATDDTIEADAAPDATDVPERCDNGLDDDGDGAVDCEDSECEFAGPCLEEECADRTDCEDRACWTTETCRGCPDEDLGSRMGSRVAQGTTEGAGDELGFACIANPVEEVALAWTAPEDGVYTFTTAGSSYDTVMGLHEGSCVGRNMGCNDTDSSLGNGWSSIRTYIDGGTMVVIVIGGWSGATGDYVLNIFPP